MQKSRHGNVIEKTRLNIVSTAGRFPLICVNQDSGSKNNDISAINAGLG